MGQLGLQPNPAIALPLLHRAATLSTPQVPQPAYVYALLLLSEFTQLPTPLPSSLFTPFIPQSSSQALEARKHLERAAYLGFAPAQYKLGHAYEFAQPPFPFDPLLSVQYYSLASQQGEVEADMALSKWFLCGSGDVGGGGGGPGAEGGFEKDESLAWTFADKAAKRGLPSAEFAMGYYAEVGVGGPKDLGAAMRWYAKAKEHGNEDAVERLSALSQEVPKALSRKEHDVITENKLVRKRTMAKERSDLHQNQTPQTLQPQVITPHSSSHQASHSHYAQPQPQVQAQNANQNPNTSANSQPPLYTAPGPNAVLRPQRRQVLENVRKSSMMIPGSYPTPPVQGHPYTNTTGSNVNPNAGAAYPNAGVGNNNNSSYGAAGNTLRPQTGLLPPPARPHSQQGQYPKRYTLTDRQMPLAPPVNNPGSPVSAVVAVSAPTTPGPGRAGRRKGSGMQGGGGGGVTQGQGAEKEEVGEVGLGGGVVYSAKPSKGPTTFAEMGFQGAKAEDKECVVM